MARTATTLALIIKYHVVFHSAALLDAVSALTFCYPSPKRGGIRNAHFDKSVVSRRRSCCKQGSRSSIRGRGGQICSQTVDENTHGASPVAVQVDNLIRSIEGKTDSSGNILDDEEMTSDTLGIISSLENYQYESEEIANKTAQSSSSGLDLDYSIFTPLLGNYDVACVIPKKKGDSPAGGKWTRKNGFAQKLFRTRRSFQHLVPVTSERIPPAASANKSDAASSASTGSSSGSSVLKGYAVVAEAVNVISLDAFAGLLRCTVILRGDAVPLDKGERETIAAERKTPGGLSKYAVRAMFDPPRIVLGKKGRVVNLNLGPTSTVVLDTTYFDDRIRLGKGASGSRFVFKRCSVDDEEANEWKELLQRRPMRRSRAFSVLGAILASGIATRMQGLRVFGTSIFAFAVLCGAIVAFSSGGIERD